MINTVTLVGRMTKDCDLKYTGNSGKAVGNFTLAVNRPFKNAQGENEADFINCTVWGKSAENLANFMRKGSQVGVIGRIQTRNFEGQDGKRVFVTEVVADQVAFLESKKESNNQPNNQQQKPNSDDPFKGNGKPINISDDDLPF